MLWNHLFVVLWRIVLRSTVLRTGVISYPEGYHESENHHFQSLLSQELVSGADVRQVRSFWRLPKHTYVIFKKFISHLFSQYLGCSRQLAWQTKLKHYLKKIQQLLWLLNIVNIRGKKGKKYPRSKANLRRESQTNEDNSSQEANREGIALNSSGWEFHNNDITAEKALLLLNLAFLLALAPWSNLWRRRTLRQICSSAGLAQKCCLA